MRQKKNSVNIAHDDNKRYFDIEKRKIGTEHFVLDFSHWLQDFFLLAVSTISLSSGIRAQI